MSTRPGLRTALRDIVSFGLGWTLIFSQSGFPGLFAQPSNPNELAMVMGGLVAGVPGLAQLIAMKWGGPTAGIGGQRSPDQPSPSGPASATPSPAPSGVE